MTDIPLTPGFDIFPHGIETVGSTSYAIFKLVVYIKELDPERLPNGNALQVTKDNWDGLKEKIDGMKWVCKFEAKQLVFNNNPKAIGIPIDFVVKNLKGLCKPKEQPKFAFGERLDKNGKIVPSFDFIDEEGYTFSIKPPPVEKRREADRQLKQFETSLDKTRKKMGEDPYSTILNLAHVYASPDPEEVPQEEQERLPWEDHYDFKPIYGALLDEPTSAEHQFGLIREFKIPIDKSFSDALNGDYTLIIQDGNDREASDHWSFLTVTYSIDNNGTTEKIEKYYNGPKKLCFDADNFHAVGFSLEDRYKAQLEATNLHPDGLYVYVVYHKTGDEIDRDKDPFQKEYVKGFNPLLKIDEKPYSVTLHNKELIFPKGFNFKENDSFFFERDSGYLTPLAQMETKNGDYRSNILMAWRGDNLMVNRLPEGLVDDDEVNTTGDAKGVFKSTPDDCKEDLFIRQHLLSKEESLPKQSQPQFTLDKSYSVIVRPVTPTHYFVLSQLEIDHKSDKHSRTLTVEELGHIIKPLIVIPQTELKASIPIKSPVIIGSKNFKNANSDFVDRQDHLVLDKLKRNEHEKRYIYPPMIKFEDFRMLGYLSKKRLTIGSEETAQQESEETTQQKSEVMTQQKYVSRCLRIEHRLKNTVPRTAWHTTNIDYLADPRGKNVYVIPSDIFTASVLKPVFIPGVFPYTNNYPYYEGVESVRLKVHQKNNKSEISLKANGKTIELYSDLENGIYNFHIYVTESSTTFSSINDIKKHNAAPLRVSILSFPEKPITNKKEKHVLTAARNAQHTSSNVNVNYWFTPITLEKPSETWKSVKYMQEDSVLRLQHQNANALLREYVDVTGHKQELLKDEYPYEIFLEKEGSLSEQGGLFTDIYPESISIKYKEPSETPPSKFFFKLKLNGSDILEAVPGALKVNGVPLKGSDFDLTVAFNPVQDAYSVFNKGVFFIKLEKYVNPDISIHDLEMDELMLKYIQLTEPRSFEFKRSEKLFFIADQKDPYSRKKRVQLFGSSIFQAYFPDSDSEFEMGSTGQVLHIDVPNNDLPKRPLIDADTLFMYTSDDKWRKEKGIRIKRNTTESLVRITMQEDFMIEGKNKLGIVISRTKDPDGKDTNVSKIGEDITKLTDTNWVDYDLKTLINFAADEIVSKYLSKDPTKYYKIGEGIYEILELEPFYNAFLRQWQIILPLKSFQESETMFIKLVSLKIAPGHGLEPDDDKIPVGATNPLVDKTGTNLSAFSDAVQLPVYTRKLISLKRDGSLYTISIGSASQHLTKIYYVIITEKNLDWTLIAIQREGEGRDTGNLNEFQCNEAENTKAGKILMFKDKQSVQIQGTTGYALTVLEFEVHENAAPINSKTDFVTYNPLFDVKGIRLINVAEFKL